MRPMYVAGAAVVVLGIGGLAFIVPGSGGKPPSQSAAVAVAPKIETAKLFSAGPPAPDLIAAKLAQQPAPVNWPEVKKPKTAPVTAEVKPTAPVAAPKAEPARTEPAKAATAAKPKKKSKAKTAESKKPDAKTAAAKTANTVTAR